MTGVWKDLQLCVLDFRKQFPASTSGNERIIVSMYHEYRHSQLIIVHMSVKKFGSLDCF